MKVTKWKKFKNYIKIRFARLKFKLQHPFTRYTITESGNAFLDYCLKVIKTEGECTPEGYAEFMADEKLREKAAENSLTVKQMAYTFIYVAVVTGAT